MPDDRPRCTVRGCPVRYRGGRNRPCPDHQSEDDAAAAVREGLGVPARLVLGVRDVREMPGQGEA